jgi:hypothetical protein
VAAVERAPRSQDCRTRHTKEHFKFCVGYGPNVPNDKGSRAWVLTELFVLLVREVTLLLAEHDRVGLIRMGAPSDEYDVEAGQIVRRVLGEAHSSRDVERIVAEVFEEYFGAGYADRSSEVSEGIWREVQQAKADSGLNEAEVDVRF